MVGHMVEDVEGHLGGNLDRVRRTDQVGARQACFRPTSDELVCQNKDGLSATSKSIRLSVSDMYQQR